MESNNPKINTLFSGLRPFLQDVWEKSGFQNPTAIQRKAIPIISEGKDIIAEAPTGSGKTLAYILPLLQKIDTDKKNIQVVILASSHELVMQIHQEIQKWTDQSGIHSAVLIGGANVKRQIEKLKKRPQIVAGTPGRMQELIRQKKIKMHEVKTVVLDEGDQLLVPEHKATIQNIIKSTLNDRQLLLFSATLSEKIEEDTKTLMKQPEVIRIQNEENKPKVEHSYFVCEAREKIDVVKKLIRMDAFRALAFVRDIANLGVLAEKLQYKGLSVSVLHSDSKKQEREKAMKAFRAGDSPLLLATDVAARGLDIKDLTHVINVDLPGDATQYVHRAGRTGRLGATSGTIINIVTTNEERSLQKYARELEIPLHKKVLYKGQMKDA